MKIRPFSTRPQFSIIGHNFRLSRLFDVFAWKTTKARRNLHIETLARIMLFIGEISINQNGHVLKLLPVQS